LQGLLTHDICLRSNCHESVDVFGYWNQYLARHMTALFGAGSLIFNVNAGSSSLDEELGQLHDCGQTAVASIGVGNDRSQIINVRDLVALILWSSHPLFSLFPVMEELCHEQLIDFVGHGILGLLSTMEPVTNSSSEDDSPLDNLPNLERAHP
jgi:hypothetical protein